MDVEERVCTLSPPLKNQALQCIRDAMQGRIEKDIATDIKRAMDAVDCGTWQCIVGEDFGASLCFENKHLLFVKVQQRHILLFRSHDE